jgi:hypothetical protein
MSAQFDEIVEKHSIHLPVGLSGLSNNHLILLVFLLYLQRGTTSAYKTNQVLHTARDF